MATRVPPRAWPFPKRIATTQPEGAEVWDGLLALADVPMPSGDARALVVQLRQLMTSVSTTMDGRLISESRPRPKEGRDPLRHEGIEGAVALSKWLADLDDDSIESVLIEGIDAIADPWARGRTSREERGRTLRELANSLRVLLPAMVRAERELTKQTSDGRPPVDRRETQCLVTEVATLWAEYAEAGPEDFHAFVERYFEFCGINAPSRSHYERALALLGDLAAFSVEDLARIREEHRIERLRLVRECDRWNNVAMYVRSDAEEALTKAAEQGYPHDGTAPRWKWLTHQLTRS